MQGIQPGVAIVGFLLSFVAGAGMMWGCTRNGPIKNPLVHVQEAVWSDEEASVPVSSKDPTWGSRTAPVTLVMFSDFQCPFCTRVGATLERIRQVYGPDKVRIVWKHEPLSFHAQAKPAAEASQGVFALAGNDAFWKFHDKAFANQSALQTDNYVRWAQEAGVQDLRAYKAGLAAHAWVEKVDKDHKVAMQAGVNGTPSFFVNGVPLSGAQPFGRFQALIDQELQKATEKLAKGTPKERLYVALSQENKKNLPAEEEDASEDSSTVFRVPVGQSPVKGEHHALVTLVIFSDFQCPFCKRAEDTIDQIAAAYQEKVRFVWKNEPLPFHSRAEPAAEFALEARAQKGDRGFWEAHRGLFASHPKLEDSDLETLAKSMGLNLDKVREALRTHKYKKQIEADQDLAEDLQAQGTPHFFVNGRRLVGAQPFEKFKGLIDEEIKKAEALLAKGVPAASLYDTLIKDGKGAPEPEKKVLAPAPNAPFKGSARAKVVIQQISDFQCPYCQRTEETMDEVLRVYGDRVKVVWRNLPLPMHPDASLAAQAGLEAFAQKGSDGFWKMHKQLFAQQGKANTLKREALDTYARTLGLDMTLWKTALDTQAHKAEIDTDMKAAESAGIQGTPAFVINGYFLSGAQPFGKFRKLIERALSEEK